MVYKAFIALLAVFAIAQVAYGQDLTLSDCTSSCVSEVTTQSSVCKSGIQCFCTDAALHASAMDCWKSNCTIREFLVAQNITSISCNFPDSDRGPTSSAVTFTSMAIALILVAARALALSANFRDRWGTDDVLVAFATVFMIANAACNPISRHYGYGRDTWRLPFAHTNIVEMMFYIGGIIYAIGVALIKVSFLVFYLRLFPSRTLRRVAIPLLVLTVVHGILFTFLFAFQCTPVSYTWTQWDGSGTGKCMSFDIGAVVHAITNICLDFLIFALPIWQLWSINLSKKKKFQVMSMFLVGFFVTLVSILRLTSLISLGNTWNPTTDFVPLGYWSDLEFNIGVACICMPSFRVVIRRYFPQCGLATTGHDDSGTGPQITPRPIDLTYANGSKNNTKTHKMPNRRVTADDDSDKVELCTYEVGSKGSQGSYPR